MTRKNLTLSALGTALAAALTAAPLAAQTPTPTPAPTPSSGQSRPDSLRGPGATTIPGTAPSPVPANRTTADTLRVIPAAPSTTAAPMDSMRTDSTRVMTQPMDSTRMMTPPPPPPAEPMPMTPAPADSARTMGTSSGTLDTPASDMSSRSARTRMKVRKDGY